MTLRLQLRLLMLLTSAIVKLYSKHKNSIIMKLPWISQITALLNFALDCCKVHILGCHEHFLWIQRFLGWQTLFARQHAKHFQKCGIPAALRLLDCPDHHRQLEKLWSAAWSGQLTGRKNDCDRTRDTTLN